MSNDARGRAWPYRVAAWICDEEMFSESERRASWRGPGGVGPGAYTLIYCTGRVALSCSRVPLAVAVRSALDLGTTPVNAVGSR